MFSHFHTLMKRVDKIALFCDNHKLLASDSDIYDKKLGLRWGVVAWGENFSYNESQKILTLLRFRLIYGIGGPLWPTPDLVGLRRGTRVRKAPKFLLLSCMENAMRQYRRLICCMTSLVQVNSWCCRCGAGDATMATWCCMYLMKCTLLQYFWHYYWPPILWCFLCVWCYH